ncbi:hypothetical protein N752_14880 [Desulforamulus aquiferis]|nr:hypothetical protein N752_14880 [Desulforamulus aquiferis]
MRYLIKGGIIVDPVKETLAQQDLLIDQGLIVNIGADISDQEAKVIEATGRYVCPGLLDMHVHLREPGYEYKEDIASGTRLRPWEALRQWPACQTPIRWQITGQ